MTASPARLPSGRRPTRWRRRLANLLILAGLSVLLYPVGTWGYTWLQQRSLTTELAGTFPALADPSPEKLFVAEDMTVIRAEQRGLVKAGRDAESLGRQQALRQASLDLSERLKSRSGEPLGRLVIPKIGLDVVMIEGTETADLRRGPGHWPETPVPGAGGNFVVSGHRTTYGAPFFSLNELEPGDEIQVLLPFGAFVYNVSRTIIVLPTETEAVAQRGIEELSLTTCEPVYSASHRLIVQAELGAFRLIGAGDNLSLGSEP